MQDLEVVGGQHVPAGLGEDVVDAAPDCVRGPAIGQHVRGDLLDLLLAVLRVDVEQGPAAGFPRHVDRHEGHVLAEQQPGQPLPEAPVGQDALGHLVDADAARPAADGLQVVVGEPSDRLHRAQDGGAEAVHPRHVPHPAFREEAVERGDPVGEGDRVEVVGEAHEGHDLHAGLDHLGELQRVEPGLRQHHEAGDVVHRARPHEGGPGIAGGGDHQDAAVVARQARQHGPRLEILERRGLQIGALLRPVAVEGDPEVRQAHHAIQPLALVGDGAPGAVELPHDRQPAVVAIDAVGGGIRLEGLRLVARAEEARLVRSRTVEQEPVVLEGRLADTTLNHIVTIPHGRFSSSCCPDGRLLRGRKQAQSPASRAGTRGRMTR